MSENQRHEDTSHTSLGNGCTSMPAEASFIIYAESWVGFTNELGILLQKNLPPFAKYAFAYIATHGIKHTHFNLKDVNTYY